MSDGRRWPKGEWPAWEREASDLPPLLRGARGRQPAVGEAIGPPPKPASPLPWKRDQSPDWITLSRDEHLVIIGRYSGKVTVTSRRETVIPTDVSDDEMVRKATEFAEGVIAHARIASLAAEVERLRVENVALRELAVLVDQVDDARAESAELRKQVERLEQEKRDMLLMHGVLDELENNESAELREALRGLLDERRNTNPCEWNCGAKNPAVGESMKRGWRVDVQVCDECRTDKALHRFSEWEDAPAIRHAQTVLAKYEEQSDA